MRSKRGRCVGELLRGYIIDCYTKHKILLDDYKVRPELNKHKNIREYLIIDFFITPNDR